MYEITEEDLHAYIDGALTRARRLDVALYLAATPAVAARVESFRAQKEGFHALFDDVVAETLPERLRHTIDRRGIIGAARQPHPSKPRSTDF